MHIKTQRGGLLAPSRSSLLPPPRPTFSGGTGPTSNFGDPKPPRGTAPGTSPLPEDGWHDPLDPPQPFRSSVGPEPPQIHHRPDWILPSGRATRPTGTSPIPRSSVGLLLVQRVRAPDRPATRLVSGESPPHHLASYHLIVSPLSVSYSDHLLPPSTSASTYPATTASVPDPMLPAPLLPSSVILVDTASGNMPDRYSPPLRSPSPCQQLRCPTENEAHGSSGARIEVTAVVGR